MEHNYVAIEKNNKADKCIDVKNAVDHKYVSIGPCKSKIFQCHVCDSVFKHRASLYKHLKGIHKVIPGGKKCMKCLENDCDAEFSTTNSFRNHLASVHNIEILTVELLFKTMSDFEIWKSDLESDNNVQYVKDTGAHLSKNKMNFFYYYRCNRTGKYRNHTNQQGRRRKLKSQGTDKINNHCTSSITVQEPLNKELDIKVTYCVTHYGHNIDLKHIRLSNAERNYIVERLRQGDSVDSILHEIKNSAVSTKFEKIHFVTRKNILRIGKSYGIDMVKEEEDKKERYSRKAKNTQERHNQAMAMPLSAVRKTSAESWIVSSNNQEEYTVIKNEFLEENHLCFSKCKDCEICIHLFSCECADNIVKSELCEHIHLVVRFLNEKDSMQNTREESLGISSDDEEDLNKLLLQQEKPVSLTQKKEQVLSEIQKLTSAVMEIDNEETLDSVLQEVIVMENILMKKQEGRSDKENLQELVNSVNNNRTGIQYTHKKIALGKSQATVLFKTLTKEFSMSDLLISVKK